MSQTSDQISLLMHLRNQGIQDTRVLGALERVPREMFVLPAFRAQAYKDMALPIACGQTISQPYVVAVMSEMLALEPGHKVLEVGTGSGYQTAVLAHLAAQVYTIERHAALADAARIRFVKLGLVNIKSFTDDGTRGLPDQAPFDRIIVTAAAPHPPEALTNQLAADGIMVMPLGERRDNQHLARISKPGGTLSIERQMPVKFVPLRENVAEA